MIWVRVRLVKFYAHVLTLFGSVLTYKAMGSVCWVSHFCPSRRSSYLFPIQFCQKDNFLACFQSRNYPPSLHFLSTFLFVVAPEEVLNTLSVSALGNSETTHSSFNVQLKSLCCVSPTPTVKSLLPVVGSHAIKHVSPQHSMSLCCFALLVWMGLCTLGNTQCTTS